VRGPGIVPPPLEGAGRAVRVRAEWRDQIALEDGSGPRPDGALLQDDRPAAGAVEELPGRPARSVRASGSRP
jgi:hypothetical protein